jgi:alpha-L-fucosidase
MLSLLTALTIMANPQPTTLEPGHPQSDRMAWWREARFGMFIHWGLYSILEGEYPGKGSNHAEWIRTTAQIPVAEYEKLLGRFNPVKFDADAWARMAKEAGMKYLVITSKHHDGFCLFDSAHTDWDVMSTPFKRDILKELSAACKRHGVRFATYHSIMDWHHPDYLPKREWEGESWREAKVGAGDLRTHTPNFSDFTTYLRSQVVEIIQKYDPGVMWFDGEWESTWTHAYGKPLYEACLRANPRIVVNNRVDKGRGGMAGMTTGEHFGDFGTPEQEIPENGLPGVDWESCITMNGNWGWNRADKNFKSSAAMIRMLVDIASKGGNYLLNIGPKPDGTFPEESVKRLKEMGDWMRANGEAIYGTQASPFGPLPWGRATLKRRGQDSTVYLHVFDWPKDGRLAVPGLGNEIRGALLVAKRQRLAVRREGSDVVLSLPPQAPDAASSTIQLNLRGAPIVYRTPEIVSDGAEFVTGIEAKIESGSPGLEVRYTLDGSEPGSSSPKYVKPLTVREPCVLKAAAFHAGKKVSSTAERRFQRVVPSPAVIAEFGVPGLRRETFAGEWDKLPNFDALKAESVESATTLDVPTSGKGLREFVGRRYSAQLRVPQDDVYVFELTADDGARLWIDDKLVVDNDGLHSPQARTGRIALAKGPHMLRIEWFNKTGGAELALHWAKLGGALKALASSDVSHSPGTLRAPNKGR